MITSCNKYLIDFKKSDHHNLLHHQVDKKKELERWQTTGIMMTLLSASA